jgi:predicted transcriptional regulator
MRRARVPWMTQADDRILETLDDSDLVLSPRILAFNNEYTRQHVSRRLSKLVDSGLVEKVDDGLYQITELGKAYLSGELDADDLEDDGE